ncbi:DUF4403 family protein [Pontibacter mangrovi]|uniref:DUF4403 family protein n=1 Tax=Pontibacter mangrovi TaxID=2589816 RepID=A0A501WFG2_9BACT|nr:DUF4403 family protein [Pontibacter mangrovi]TPE44266.1 DUF4403 family protein [Pontibacter mangrovi]
MGPGFESQRDHSQSLKRKFGAFSFTFSRSTRIPSKPLNTTLARTLALQPMEDAIRIHLPVTVSYPALQGVLKSQLAGEFLPKPEEGSDAAPYVQILDVGISGSDSGNREVILRIRASILRTIMKRDQADLYVRASLGYDNASQELYVQHYHLSSRTSSTLYNTALEVMVNKAAYSQIIKKARLNVAGIIATELSKANAMLAEGFQAKGIKLLGAVTQARVLDITPTPDSITLSVELGGNLQASVLNLSELLPPQ